MGITSAITAVASLASGHKAQRQAKSEQARQQREMAKQEAKQKKQEEIEAAKLAALKPGGTSAGQRIALERRQLARSSGKGRSGSVIRRSGSLG